MLELSREKGVVDKPVVYKCKQCELNVVEHEGDFCSLCKPKPKIKKIRENGYFIERSSWCWRCKAPLNSRYNPTCAECGWLICNKCGACNCD